MLKSNLKYIWKAALRTKVLIPISLTLVVTNL